ncbi:MAG TPA: tryptophan-rich sensory protein, partial [Candidatus Luteococcus avicola]|nr:tryptophan-rich sensory protein [Candidatus Luteococcus avicola]
GVNLVLNGGWSWVFWQARQLGAATGVAAALAASSADLVRRVGKRRERGVILAPYAAWTAFATVLTAELWRRNR